jgi:hypothetical protein
MCVGRLIEYAIICGYRSRRILSCSSVRNTCRGTFKSLIRAGTNESEMLYQRGLINKVLRNNLRDDLIKRCLKYPSAVVEMVRQ